MDDLKIKPGLVSTELWVTLAASIMAILVAMSVLSQDQADVILKVIVALIQALVVIIPSVAYIFKRSHLKQDQLKYTYLLKNGKEDPLG